MSGSQSSLVSWFRTDTRGQAYTLEAIISVILIVTVVLFIAPSIATTPSNEQVTQLQEEKEISDDVVTMLEQHTDNGELKSLILNYDDTNNEWQDDYPGDGEYNYEGGATPGIDRPYLTAPGPVGQSIDQIEDRHDVAIELQLVPSTGDSSASERIEFVRPFADGTDIMAAETIEVTLFDDDRLMSESQSHARTGSTVPQTEGNGDRLIETDNFPIDKIDSDSDGVVYNTVTVQVIVYDDTVEDRN